MYGREKCYRYCNWKRCNSNIRINTWVKGNEELIDRYISELEQNRDNVNIFIKPRIDKYLLELCSIKSLLNNNLNKVSQGISEEINSLIKEKQIEIIFFDFDYTSIIDKFFVNKIICKKKNSC